MPLSDEKMMLLEQLTYMDSNVYGKLGLNYSKDRMDIIQKIKSLDDSQINKLQGLYANKKDEIKGDNWIKIIRSIKYDKEFDDYKCVDYDKNAGAYCFENTKTNEAVVAFRGTLKSNNEWPDNMIGLYSSDTPQQRVALDYVNKLTKYKSISLVGHSKGGNKAQYCGVLADKVNIDKVVSMDGQGHSIEFLEKYKEQIANCKVKITDYSYKADFVNILLNDLPGAKQVYCDGNAVGATNHVSDSMLVFRENGEGYEVGYEIAEQNAGMKYLHNFSCYLTTNLTIDEKKKLAVFLAELSEHTVGNGEKINLLDFLDEHSGESAIFLAHLINYINQNGLSEKEVKELLIAFGIKEEWYYNYIVNFAKHVMKEKEGDSPGAKLRRMLIPNKSEMFTAAVLKGWGLVNDDVKKGLRIAEEAQSYYRDNIRDGSPDDHVKGFEDYFRGKDMIKVTPELLLSQAKKLDAISDEYRELTDTICQLIDSTDKNVSKLMSSKTQNSKKLLTENIKKLLELLESGARAADTAAITYQSVDKELAKTINKYDPETDIGVKGRKYIKNNG